MGRTAVAASPALAAGGLLPRQQIPAAAAADWPCALSAKSGERAAGRSHGHAARRRNSTAYDRRHWGVRDSVPQELVAAGLERDAAVASALWDAGISLPLGRRDPL